MTDARTRRAHLVTDAAFAAGRVDAGRYVTACGIVALPAKPDYPGSQLLRLLCLLAQARESGRGRTEAERGDGS
jgi:hypothetical protein